MLQPSLVEQKNIPTASLQKGKTCTKCPGYEIEQSETISQWWGSCPGAFGNAEYPFIAIGPWFTLAHSGSTW